LKTGAGLGAIETASRAIDRLGSNARDSGATVKDDRGH